MTRGRQVAAVEERCNVVPELRNLLVPVTSIVVWPGNARIGDLDLLATSLRENAQYRPVLVQQSTNQIMAGNQTYRAATELLDWSHVAAQFIDVSDRKAREIVLMDNRAADRGSYDEAALYALLADLSDGDDASLLATGYDQEALELLRYTSGALLSEQTEFLAGLDDGTSPTQFHNADLPGVETNMVNLVFSFTAEDKDVVIAKLRAVMREDGVTTMAAALLRLCQQ